MMVTINVTVGRYRPSQNWVKDEHPTNTNLFGGTAGVQGIDPLVGGLNHCDFPRYVGWLVD